MKPLKIAAIVLFIACYLYLIKMVLYDSSTDFNPIPEQFEFLVIWVFGISNYITNIIYALNKGTNVYLTFTIGISGIVWALPFLWMTYIGFPFAFIFLITCIYLHIKY